MISKGKRGPRLRRTQAHGMEAVRRRCLVCEWEDEVVHPIGDDPDCPWCHAPTVRIATLAATPVVTEAHDAPDGKNPHAAALGRMGGSKGGRARARALTAAQRRRIASRAARARWGKKKNP